MTIPTSSSSPDPEASSIHHPRALPLPGPTTTDTIVLRESVRAALRSSMLTYLVGAEIATSAEKAGLSPAEIEEAFGELHRCRLLTVFGYGGALVRVDLSRYGLLAGLPTAEPRAEEIRLALIAGLLALDSAGPQRWMDFRNLADRYGTESLVVEQLLTQLKDQHLIGFVPMYGGVLLARINPALRRQLP
ncbi:hypothetical protein [Kitasatospora griseola]|uniref:hypothetical protein n=1 Tax=Kitasatospora griseola TaxID=2064 RepID=UPI00166F9A4D|nr:hypothetical protein [Kitasatospora griseola]GGR05529.1 hypothetical protein GCM10010195_71040 [Kitasatospora griseola]